MLQVKFINGIECTLFKGRSLHSPFTFTSHAQSVHFAGGSRS